MEKLTIKPDSIEKKTIRYSNYPLGYDVYERDVIYGIADFHGQEMLTIAYGEERYIGKLGEVDCKPSENDNLMGIKFKDFIGSIGKG